jgi:hypothetical protein
MLLPEEKALINEKNALPRGPVQGFQMQRLPSGADPYQEAVF